MKKLRVQLKVIPGASKSSIEWHGDKLKVKVNVAPERGRANEAVIKDLSVKLGVPPTSIEINSGHTTPHKTIDISGYTMEMLLGKIPR